MGWTKAAWDAESISVTDAEHTFLLHVGRSTDGLKTCQPETTVPPTQVLNAPSITRGADVSRVFAAGKSHLTVISSFQGCFSVRRQNTQRRLFTPRPHSWMAEPESGTSLLYCGAFQKLPPEQRPYRSNTLQENRLLQPAPLLLWGRK